MSVRVTVDGGSSSPQTADCVVQACSRRLSQQSAAAAPERESGESRPLSAAAIALNWPGMRAARQADTVSRSPAKPVSGAFKRQHRGVARKLVVHVHCGLIRTRSVQFRGENFAAEASDPAEQLARLGAGSSLHPAWSRSGRQGHPEVPRAQSADQSPAIPLSPGGPRVSASPLECYFEAPLTNVNVDGSRRSVTMAEAVRRGPLETRDAAAAPPKHFCNNGAGLFTHWCRMSAARLSAGQRPPLLIMDPSVPRASP